MNQHTIGKTISLTGVGLHTGNEVTVTILPAEINHGIKFQRIDLENQPFILANVSKVSSTNRSTSLKQRNAEVITVEHLLSALVGLAIDNVLIQLDAPELPILDGSAAPFVKAIESAGIMKQDAERQYLVIKKPISYKDEATGTEIIAIPSDEFEVTTMIDFDSSVLGLQYAYCHKIEDYKTEIAPCRTFVFLRELEYLMDQGLIKGGDIDNAIVIVDKKMNTNDFNQLAVKLDRTDVQMGDTGILNNTKLNFKNEPARHKLLDLIGDMALVGRPIRGKIIATKPGHTSNVAFAKLLYDILQKDIKLKGKPDYDPSKPPKMTTTDIMKMLPHRYPMLMVDKVIELTKEKVVGVKNITMNEALLQGHFPGNPVFPGVLQMEALAQAGGILALSMQEEGEWDTYFLKIDNAKFRHMVFPGDTMLLKMELMGPVRRGVVQMYGTAYVGDKLVSEGELTAQIIKRTPK